MALQPALLSLPALAAHSTRQPLTRMAAKARLGWDLHLATTSSRKSCGYDGSVAKITRHSHHTSASNCTALLSFLAARRPTDKNGSKSEAGLGSAPRHNQRAKILWLRRISRQDNPTQSPHFSFKLHCTTVFPSSTQTH